MQEPPPGGSGAAMVTRRSFPRACGGGGGPHNHGAFLLFLAGRAAVSRCVVPGCSGGSSPICSYLICKLFGEAMSQPMNSANHIIGGNPA